MIELTDRAEAAISAFLSQASGRFAGLRIGVKDASCSGVTYALALVEQGETDDISLVCGTVAVFIDARSVTLLAGCQVDFVAENGGGFSIANPNVRSCSAACPSVGNCAA